MGRTAKHDWNLIKKHYQSGHMSQSEIVRQFRVDKGTLSKKIKEESWEINQLADKAITASIEKNQHLNQLNQLDPEMVGICEKIADKKSKAIEFFSDSAMLNQQVFNIGLNAIAEEAKNSSFEAITNMGFLEAHSRSTQRNKETVLGKEATTQINNTNETKNAIVFKRITNE